MNDSQQVPSFKVSTKKTYFSLYIIAHICLFIAGLTFSNILHFFIEDHFGEALTPSFFFGHEYALSLSWLLITSLTYIILIFVIKRNDTQYSEIFFNKSRIYTLNTLLYAGCVFTFFYVVKIIYGFFSGYSDSYGLLRICVTFAILILGIFYTFVESRYFDITQNRFYLFSITGLLLIINIWSVVLTFRYAPPQLIKQYERDIKKITTIREITFGIKKYYENFNKLPATLTALNDYGFLASISDIQKYQYQVVTNQSFDICTTFEGNSEDARRIYTIRPLGGDHFKKGHQCERIFIEKGAEGKLILKSDFSPNINIQFFNSNLTQDQSAF